jgi:hypothetical protein
MNESPNAMCCFCGEIAPKCGYDPVSLLVRVPHGPSQELWAHSLCMSRAVNPLVPTLPFEGNESAFVAAQKAKERAFLAAIKANPEDVQQKLAYTECLDYARSQLIYIQEEMRRIPVFSDRYWELKPRRNFIRSRCEKRWLETMRYGSYCDPIFNEIPDGWKERWRLIREFIERWHELPMGDVGGQRQRIRDIEETVGYRLPPSIQEWIALVGDLLDNMGYDLVFRDSLSFCEVKENNAFSLMIQGEGDYHWAVPKEHLGEADPPVHGYMLDPYLEIHRPEDIRFVHDKQCASRVTVWALGFIRTYCYEICYRTDGNTQGDGVDSANLANLLADFRL